MHYCNVTFKCLRNSAVTLMFLKSLAAGVTVAVPVRACADDLEIPISELNKVKKKVPVKQSAHESRKKRKKATGTQQAASSGTAQPALPGAAAENTESQNIHHSPYSFVVADKQTHIQAVVSIKSDICEVRCILLSVNGESPAQIKMELVSGTRFTYAALLPAVSSQSSTLRYEIVVTDIDGKITRSTNFTTPVTVSSVIPVWQQQQKNVEAAPEAASTIEPGKETKASGPPQ